MICLTSSNLFCAFIFVPISEFSKIFSNVSFSPSMSALFLWIFDKYHKPISSLSSIFKRSSISCFASFGSPKIYKDFTNFSLATISSGWLIMIDSAIFLISV